MPENGRCVADMEKKARIGRSALLIIGIIYTALGGTFVILGIALAALLRDSDAFMVGLIFGGIGAIFLILGIIFLIVELCKKKRSDALLASGHYILGEVVDIAANINVNVNGRYPYYIVVQYIDPHGVRHIFKIPLTGRAAAGLCHRQPRADRCVGSSEEFLQQLHGGQFVSTVRCGCYG